MDSWVSGRSSGQPASASPHRDAVTDRGPAGWPSPGPLLDGSSPLHARVMQPPPTVLLAGDIDEQTYPGLLEVLATVARTGERRVRLDLADVEYCDLAGLRAIVALADRGGDGGRCPEQVILAHVPGFLRTVLRILGWDTAPGLTVEDEAF